MTWLVLGLTLWIVAHGFRRVAPRARAAMGDAGKGLVAVTLLAGVVLMVIGYRAAPMVPLYTPLPGMGHLNNLLMLVAVFLLGAGHAHGVVAARLRHPMLSAVVLWSVAHLLVNGDLASLLLFGGLGLWALWQMLAINRTEGVWVRPAPGPVRNDMILAVIAILLFGVITGIHIWLGHNPFLGTYR